MKRTLLAPPLALALLAATWCAAAEAPEAPPEKTIRGKVRTEVAFSLAAEFPNAEGREYGLTRVQRGGVELPPPANMKLDPKTGAFAWTPTESQCGEYEIHFLVRNANGENTRTTRLVAVETPPIVPPGDSSEIAKLLRQWAAEGTAAGNLGDFYDNRDRGHSLLNTQPYPQLDRVEYSKEQLDRRMDWALQLRFLYPHVTFGNSSTASGDPNLGSNPRHALLNPGAAQVLHTHYLRSHLYIYPEHRDHDPGHNGRGGGYGDLFPANTPYFIISQGSSGSDQPFMRAVPYTLAAFRPEVKALLIQRGLLMPTVQMILRRCGKGVNKPEDYLTGAAHPTVFEGSEVSALRMVQLAHEIQRDNVPPLAQIAAVEEDLALNGVDYFDDPRLGERFFETPVVIARLVRSAKHTRRMVVSAKGSFDANNRPLTYHWVVLRGDASRIKITPVEKDGSVAELLVPYHERRPVAPGSPLESNRVDIGVFVHNGVYYSPPAFVCFYSLDDEARTYDDQGRIREMYYGYGDSSIGYPHGQLRARDKGYDVTDWPALLAVIVGGTSPSREKGGDLASGLLRRQFKPDQLAALQQAAKDLEAAVAANAEPQRQLDEADAAAKKAREAADDAKKKAEEARKAQEKEPTDAAKAALADAEAKLKALQAEQQKAEDQARDLRRKLDEARQGEHKALVAEPPALGAPVKFRVEAALNALKDDVALYPTHARAIHALADACQDAAAKRAFLGARDELVKLGLLRPEGDGFVLSPAIAGPKPPAERLTRFERSKLEWLNIAILQHLLYPGTLNRRPQRNFVCVFLATPKTWRDLYHYDGQGRLTGWTRTEGTEAKEFTADGALITKKDALGRALEARTVAYVTEGGERINRVLQQKLGDTIRHYEYADDKDRIGRVARTEKAPE
ncbi:MAG TPA: putative Ig domain-containing protein [Planctomycetota bacterium]|nr:putative Ig domain-containing protein [Planctomycetota bacterium]HRR80191.1 putative Ig domain-containing protein [Planctomycetota bacterium]HRT94744.1 putative Ig domain-containing protein [Planctomycetota bacterium]